MSRIDGTVRCPDCGDGPFEASLNLHAPGPNPPAYVYGDEGRPIHFCPECDCPLDARELLEATA